MMHHDFLSNGMEHEFLVVAEDQVAEALQRNAKPDLIISFGHPLNPDAQNLVRGLDSADDGRPRHIFAKADYDDNDNCFFPLHDIVEKLDEELGRPAKIMVHCTQGVRRSPFLAANIHAGRLLRGNIDWYDYSNDQEAVKGDISQDVQSYFLGDKTRAMDIFYSRPDTEYWNVGLLIHPGCYLKKLKATRGKAVRPEPIVGAAKLDKATL